MQCIDYLANQFLNMPSARNRILGCQLWLNEAKGFLHWGFNFYNDGLSHRSIDPFRETDAGGHFPAGDSFVVYPGEDGALDSLRLEVFYDDKIVVWFNYSDRTNPDDPDTERRDFSLLENYVISATSRFIIVSIKSALR